MQSTIITVAAFAASVMAMPAATSASVIAASGIPIVPTIFPSLALSDLIAPSPANGIVLPSPISMGTNSIGTFGLLNQALIENAACDLTQNLAPFENLVPLFGVGEFIGEMIGPALNRTFGGAFVNDIDIVADQLCVSAQQEEDDGLGVCQTSLAALFDLTKHDDPTGVKDFKCFLALACVAPTGNDHTGTCQELLAGSDCLANRIIDESAPECCPPDNVDCFANPTNSKQ